MQPRDRGVTGASPSTCSQCGADPFGLVGTLKVMIWTLISWFIESPLSEHRDALPFDQYSSSGRDGPPTGTIVIFRSGIGRVIGAYYQLNSIPGPP
ncbi:hypothetical protein [Actinomadura soli]|uniref:hypothetical protein n=1 Tax=Actinomadura soli TaxID=2508997 RepID=UPI0014874229|nr:hypothetical protein [Actinomadura soli]